MSKTARIRLPRAVKWGIVGILGLLLVVLLVDGLAGDRIHVWRLARKLDAADPVERTDAADALAVLGRPYREAIAAEVRSGGRSVRAQAELARIAFIEPYYLAEELRDTLASDDETVRNAAVIGYLDHGVDLRDPKPLRDDLFSALGEWARPENAASPLLDRALNRLAYYRDPRIPDLLLPVATAASAAGADPEEARRAARTRAAAVLGLEKHVGEPKVRAALAELAGRTTEPPEVQREIWRAIVTEGFPWDEELLEKGASAEDQVVRHIVAQRLREYSDPRSLSILERLLGDPVNVVRRAALATLIEKNAPVVMDDLPYLAEDAFRQIAGDLAQAVGTARARRFVPFLAWCLTEAETAVVEKAMTALHTITGKAWVLSDEEFSQYLASSFGERDQLLRGFLADEERQEEAVAAVAREHPPRYTDRDRVPHLVRMLGHRSPENVARAIRELHRITGRGEGLPAPLVTPGATRDEEDAAVKAFMNGDRERVQADWRSWWERQ